MNDALKRKFAVYLHEKFGEGELCEISLLGKGWHGRGYKIKYKTRDKTLQLVLREKNDSNFSNDYKSDRAASFILSHEAAAMPKHARSIDIVGVNSEVMSLGKCSEYYQLTEVAKGTEYMNDFKRILHNPTLAAEDTKRALLLSDFLVELHTQKYTGNEQHAHSLYKRHLRDCIGNGEMLMGVIDTYPEITFATEKQITYIITKSVELREKRKNLSRRLRRVHGDFHPGNVMFDGDEFTLLDASRILYGDPADDITAMGINYLWFALQQRGEFSGPFRELFDLFWKNYLKKTNDKEVNVVAPIFLAFRGLVIAHPSYQQPQEVRENLIRFVINVLNDGIFDYQNLHYYLR